MHPVGGEGDVKHLREVQLRGRQCKQFSTRGTNLSEVMREEEEEEEEEEQAPSSDFLCSRMICLSVVIGHPCKDSSKERPLTS